MKLLKIGGYLSLILGLLILFNYDLLGSLPYFINAVLSFRYVEKNYKNREFMVAYTVVMLLLNMLLLGENELAIFDIGAWGFLLYTWLVV